MPAKPDELSRKLAGSGTVAGGGVGPGEHAVFFFFLFDPWSSTSEANSPFGFGFGKGSHVPGATGGGKIPGKPPPEGPNIGPLPGYPDPCPSRPAGRGRLSSAASNLPGKSK